MKHSTHNTLALLASLVAVSLIVSALRQRRLSVGPPRRAPRIRVGFVGNSFTYYNDLPGVLARATGQAGACWVLRVQGGEVRRSPATGQVVAEGGELGKELA